MGKIPFFLESTFELRMMDAPLQLSSCENRTNTDAKYHATTAENASTLVWALFHILCGGKWRMKGNRKRADETDKRRLGDISKLV